MGKVKKTYLGVVLIALILAIGFELRAESYSKELEPVASNFPNDATGQVVWMPLPGRLRSHYVTLEQWQRIAPYWDTARIFRNVFVALAIAGFAYVAYSRFMRGYRTRPQQKL